MLRTEPSWGQLGLAKSWWRFFAFTETIPRWLKK
jgi:hypothetical protein